MRTTLAAPPAALLAAALLLAAGTAAGAPPAQVEAAPDAAAEAPAAPRAIPVEQVFRAADELDGPLRKAEESAQVDPVVEEVAGRLAAAAREAGELRAALAPEQLREVSAREIERLQQALAREDQLLAGGQALLEKRQTALAESGRALKDQQATWQLTAEAARQAQAPPPVMRRVAQVLERLQVEAGRLRARQDRLLGLQGQVSDLRADLGRAAATVDAANATLSRQLFELESAPLWRALSGSDRAGALGVQLRQAAREMGRDVAAFLAEQQAGLWIHLGVALLYGLALLALRRPVAAMGEGDPALRGARSVLDRPWSAAVLLSVPALGLIYGPLAPTLRDLLFLALLFPLLRLLPGLLPQVFRRPLFGLAALFALDRLAAIAPPRTLLARLLLLAVTAGALAGLAAGLRRRGWARSRHAGGRWGAALTGAAAVAAGLLAVSAVSNLVGNSTLAERLTRATLGSATLAALLVAVQVGSPGTELEFAL